MSDLELLAVTLGLRSNASVGDIRQGILDLKQGSTSPARCPT